jgi:CheY-like chemotaxis protein
LSGPPRLTFSESFLGDPVLERFLHPPGKKLHPSDGLLGHAALLVNSGGVKNLAVLAFPIRDVSSLRSDESPPVCNSGQSHNRTYESIIRRSSYEGARMLGTRILLVDDNESVRVTMQKVLETNGFQVVAAANVNAALRFIAMSVRPFDVLLSDLHMPGKGDGLVVASAMRHSNPEAITLLMSGYPEMLEAAAAIRLQADHILVKPLEIQPLIDLIREELSNRKTIPRKDIAETVATILEQNSALTIEHWLERVAANKDLAQIAITAEERTGHLPRLIEDLVRRLREPQSLETGRTDSAGAREHGTLRRQQGYSAGMIVEESRMLQVSIFQTLQNNLNKVNFSLVLMDVMVLADEIDWQLTQAIRSYMGEQSAPVAA